MYASFFRSLTGQPIWPMISVVEYSIRGIDMNSEQIAKLAGVSRATVSRVINNSVYVKDETRKKIEVIMKEKGFVPSESARRLAGAPVTTLGLFIVDINEYVDTHRISHSDYFSHFTTYLIDHAKAFNKDVLVTLITSYDGFEKIRQLHKNHSIGSAVVIGATLEDAQVGALQKIDIPSVLIDMPEHLFKDYPHLICANFSNTQGAFDATRHILKKGYKKILHMAGNQLKYSGKQRLDGYLKALDSFGIAPDENLILYGNFSEQQAHNLAYNYLKKNTVDAVFCGNDMMAFGVYRACSELGISIPEDLAVIGFDNSPIGEYVHPKLSTVALSLDLLALKCLRLLEAINYTTSTKIPETLIPAEITLRDSI